MNGPATKEPSIEQAEAAVRRALIAELRERAFAVGAADVDAGDLYGVVIETAFADEMITQAVLADGSVSLYVDSGEGCLGCGEHLDVRHAAQTFLQNARPIANEAAFVFDRAAPTVDHVKFVFMQPQGLRAVQIRLQDAQRADSPLGRLFFEAHRLMQLIERVGAGRSLRDEVAAARAQIEAADEAMTPAVRAVDIGARAQVCWSVGNAVRRLRT